MERDLQDSAEAEAWVLGAQSAPVKGWALDALAAMQVMVSRAIVCVQNVVPKLSMSAQCLVTRRNAHHAEL